MRPAIRHINLGHAGHRRPVRRLAALAALAGAVVAATFSAPVVRAATSDSPVGEWQTIDDHTGKPRGVVRIFEQNGMLYGVVEKAIIDKTKPPPSPTCDKCTDDRHGKQIIGLDIIRGLKHDGDQWDGGTILDPENGKVYRCKLTLEDGGKLLDVRGYIGVSLFGRTQVWHRLH